MLTDPIIVDATLMAVLRSYVETGVDEVSCFAARFLNLFVNEAPLLESYEIDNFILRSGQTLCHWLVGHLSGCLMQLLTIFPKHVVVLWN